MDPMAIEIFTQMNSDRSWKFMRDYDRRGRPKRGGVGEDESSNIGKMYHDSVGNSKRLCNWLYLYKYIHIII